MQHLVNVIFGEPGHRCSFTVQQGEYNSREVVCAMWQAMPGGGKLPFRTEGISVMVVYKYGSATSPQYATTICGDNEVCFVIPQHVLAGAGKAEMQLLVYAERSLLKSAIVPFKILDSLNPSAVCEPDVEPELLGILTQVRSVLTKATESEKARAEAEAARAKQFAEWEAVMDNLEQNSLQVYNAATRFEFPSVGSADVIYKAETEKKIYQWNSTEMKYELLNEASSGGDIQSIQIINGGDASGID